MRSDAKFPDLNKLFQAYESNYRQILRLIPDLGVLDGEYLSIRSDQVHLLILENTSYHTTFTLSQNFALAGKYVSDPKMKIRFFWDARVAEVLICDFSCSAE